jgi:hypothetical protein
VTHKGKPMPSILTRVNRTKVTPELLRHVIEMHSQMSAEDRPVLEAQIVRIFQLLDEKGFTGNRHADLSIAIRFRLEALAKLIKTDATRGWTMPGREPGATSIDFDLLIAAAEERLIEGTDGQVAFDPDGFQKRVLRISEARGQA